MNTFVAVCAGVLLGAGTAGAQARIDAPWRVGISLGARFHADSSVDAFASGRSQFASGLSLSRDVATFRERGTVAVDLDWSMETLDGGFGQAFHTRLSAHALTAGLSVRWHVARWFEPYARASVGAGYSDLALTPQASSNASALAGDAWTLLGTAGAGVQLTTGTFLRRARFVFAVEAGGVFAMSQTMRVAHDAAHPGSTPADALPVGATTLGGLNLGGGSFKMLVGLRF